jgi:hypothetical protein
MTDDTADAVPAAPASQQLASMRDSDDHNKTPPRTTAAAAVSAAAVSAAAAAAAGEKRKAESTPPRTGSESAVVPAQAGVNVSASSTGSVAPSSAPRKALKYNVDAAPLILNGTAGTVLMPLIPPSPLQSTDLLSFSSGSAVNRGDDGTAALRHRKLPIPGSSYASAASAAPLRTLAVPDSREGSMFGPPPKQPLDPSKRPPA